MLLCLCVFCSKSTKTNLCSVIRNTQGKGLMPDGTSRFTCKRNGEVRSVAMLCERTTLFDGD